MPKRSSLYLETTEVPPERTAGEIIGLLVRGGAREVAMSYDGGQKVVGLRFTIQVGTQQLLFALPARTDPVYEYLHRQVKDRPQWFNREDQVSKLRAKAERIAWRQLLRWIQAQLAMIETGMVKTHEVFLPYLEQNGKTLFEAFVDRGLRALPAPRQSAPEGTKDGERVATTPEV
jgi:hypothetical protein